MLSNTSFRSIHQFRNSRADSRVSSARSVGYYVPKEDRQEQLTALRTASFNLGYEKPSYVSTQQELMPDGGGRTPVNGQLAGNRSRLSSARSELVGSEHGHASAQNIQAKLKARNWSLAHAGSGDNGLEPQTMHRRFYDEKGRDRAAYNRDKEQWREQANYLRASHIEISVRQFENTFTTTNREQEKANKDKLDSSRSRLNADSSQGSLRSNNLGSAASLKKSSIQLGSDKKYYHYKDARTAFQDGYKAPMGMGTRGRSQLASIKEKDLERNESEFTLDRRREAEGAEDGKSVRGQNDDDCLGVTSRDYAAYGNNKMALTMNNFKFSYNDNLTGQQRFNDHKTKQDKMQMNFDFIKTKVGTQPRSQSAIEDLLQSNRGTPRDQSAKGGQLIGAHDKTFDIFVGGRSAGSRDRDYKSMQKMTQVASASANNPQDYAKTHAAYMQQKAFSHSKNFVYDSELECRTPLKSRGNDSLMNEKLATRLGLTEQMEKYINHDLGLIQEEQEQNNQQSKKAREKQNVDLSTHKNRFTGNSTYNDEHYQKSAKTKELSAKYRHYRDYDRQSSMQRHKDSMTEHQKMQLRALRRAGKEESINLQELERLRQEQIQLGYQSEAKQNFSKSNLAKAYGASGQAQWREKLAIVAKGKAQHFEISRQTNQGAVFNPVPNYGHAYEQRAKGHRMSIPEIKSLVLVESDLPPAILAQSRRLAPSVLNQGVRGTANPSFFNSGQVYKMPSIHNYQKNFVPVATKRSARGIPNPAGDRNGEPDVSSRQQRRFGSISHPDARLAKTVSTLADGKGDLLFGYMAAKRGGAPVHTVAKNSPNGRYSSLKSVLQEPRASVPRQQQEYEYKQPRLLRQAFENLKYSEQSPESMPGSLAHVQKIYTDTRLLRRIFKKEGEGQASLSKELPLVDQSRARSNIATSPRDEPGGHSIPPRRQSESPYKTSNQSFMRWIQPVPRPKQV